MDSQSSGLAELLDTALGERLPDAYWVAELIASIPIGIGIVSAADLAVMAANPAMRTALRISEASVAGRRITDLVPSSHPLADTGPYQHVVRTGQPIDLEAAASEGGRRHYSIRALKSSSGDVRHLLIGVVELGDASEELGRLREVELAKKEFLKLAAHELRTPLAVIIGYASLLAPGGLSPAHQQLAGLRIYQKARQLNRLITGLSQVARFDEIGPGMPKEDLDLAALLAELVRDAQRRALDLAVLLHLDIVAAPVRGNRVWLAIAIQELLENAMRFRPGPGRVDVQLSDARDRWVITVTDDGFGIDPDDQPRLFQRFSRVETDANRHLVGLGIGLYLVREVAAAHQGHVEVQSASKVGSRFRLELPKGKLNVRSDFAARLAGG